MKTGYLVFSLFLILGGCKPSVPNGPEATMTIAPLTSARTVNSLLPYIDSIVIVPLETSEASFVQEVNKMLLLPNGNFIAKSNGDMLLFQADGSFLYRIGQHGRGPEEYRTTEDICLSRDAKELWILSLDEIVVYRIADGKFLRKVKPEKPAYCPFFNAIASGSDGSVFLYSCRMSSDTDFQADPCLIRFDRNGKQTHAFLPQKDYGIDISLITQSYDNRYILRPQDNSNICHYLGDSLPLPQVKVDFGDKTITNRFSSDLQTYLRSDYYKMPIFIHDTESQFFFTYCGPEAREYYCIHDIPHNRTITWKRSGEDTQAMFQILASDSEFFYGLYNDYRSPEELPIDQLDLLKQAVIQKTGITLKDDVNPVLVKIKFSIP